MSFNEIEKIKKESKELIRSAKDLAAVEQLQIRFLGRKGALSGILRSLKNLPLKERQTVGPAAQQLKKELEKLIQEKISVFSKSAQQGLPGIDITMPGKKIVVGHLHPLTIVEKEIREIFKAMNFSVVEGPEVETEYYNFDALNIPKNHPARDMWDTFWLKDSQKQLTSDKKQLTNGQESNVKGQMLLRTHTSPVQIRYMEQHQPPFQIIVPGQVFRYEATDASHEINFYQVEGLMVGKEVNLANFKFVIREFFKRLFKRDIVVRFRPSYFPFVEPGLEVDVRCIRCDGRARLPDGQGCGICKESGWLEVMGAGMVHPRVFEAAHYNPREWQGFAFGLGMERIAMIKYNIPDIRLFYSGDLRFIQQF